MFVAERYVWAFLQVLEQVYISRQNVDEDLVNSILWPSEHPNAAESFYQIISKKGTPVNVLLSKLDKVLNPRSSGFPSNVLSPDSCNTDA